MSSPRATARSVLKRTLGATGEVDTPPGSTTVSRLLAVPDENESSVEYVERRLASRPSSAASCASCCAVRTSSAARVSTRAWVESMRPWVSARSASIDFWNVASRPWMVGDAAMSWSPSALASLAARAGSASSAVMNSIVLLSGDSTRTRSASCIGRLLETELSDHRLEDRARLRDRRVRRGQALRDEELRVVGVRRRQRLADDERGLRFVDLLLKAADPEGRGASKQGGHDHERQPGPEGGDQATEIHGGFTLCPLRAGPFVRRQCWATPTLAMIDQEPRCVKWTDSAMALASIQG